MKLLILIMLFVLASCGGGDGNVDHPVTDFDREWHFHLAENGLKKMDSIDLSNPQLITMVNVENGGVVTNCVFTADYNQFNEYIGDVDLRYVSGDVSVCVQYIGNVNFRFFNVDGIDTFFFDHDIELR